MSSIEGKIEKLVETKITNLGYELYDVQYVKEGKDYLQYEWLDLNKIEEYPLYPKAIQIILKEQKFPAHKINDEL